MTTKDEVRSTIEALRTERALKLALEALELGDDASLAERDHAITAIRSVLNEHGEALAHAPEVREQPKESPKFDPNESFEREEAAVARVREFMRNH